jgi:hypothetical protein
VFDPSGNWTIGAVDFTLPSGVSGPCAGGQHNDCEGPPDGQNLYMKMISGTQVSSGSALYGLQLWQGDASTTGQQADVACGSKIGLTTAQQSALGISFAGNAADGGFALASSVPSFHDDVDASTGTVTLTNNWKMNTAKTQYDFYDCGSHSVTLGGKQYTAYRCGPDSAVRYQLNLEGGCTINSSGLPTNLTDWSAVNTCASAIDSNGIRTSTCTGSPTIEGVVTPVTCKNVWAVASDVNDTIDTDMSHNFDFNSVAKVSQGTLCSAMTGIAQLQCYSNYYYQSGMSRKADVCLPRVDTDWTATTAADFVTVNFRPNTLVFMDEYKPYPDGSGGALLTREEQWRGVQVSANNYVNCRVIQTGSLTLRKVSDTKMLANYQQSIITTSRTKPACVANFNGTRSSFLFYLTK